MAMLEKVCECGSDDCTYHGIKMYNFKKNNLQINPECRSKFKGKKANAVIVLQSNSSSGWTTYSYKKNHRELITTIYKYEYATIEKWHGRLYSEDHAILFKLNKKGFKEAFLMPLRKNNEVLVAVAIEGKDSLLYNHLSSKKSLRAFKKNMRKLFGYDIEMTIDLQYNQRVEPFKLIDCYYGDF